jgi:UDP-glucose 4-epimerase
MSVQAFKPSRVVVLGARGFIASTLRKQLQSASIQVLALGSQELDLLSPHASSLLASQLRSDDALVMLSAITPDKGRDTAAFMNNLTMMQNVCTALKHQPVSHLVYFSSDAVYGLKESVVSEASPVGPQDLYGAMHLSRELMARALTGIPTAIFRVTMVYGPGDTHSSYGPNRFFRAAEKDQKITLFGGGEELRDHIHVEDVAALTMNCLRDKFTGLLNIATGVSTSFHAAAKLVAQQFEGVKVVITPRANLITYRHYDISNLIKTFPRFRFTSLSNGISTYRKNSQKVSDGRS